MKNKFNLNNYFLISYNLDINNFKNNNKGIQYEYGQKTYVNIYKEKNKKTFLLEIHLLTIKIIKIYLISGKIILKI